MYKTTTLHLHPSLKKCPVCQSNLEEWYRKKGKTIKTLQGEKYIVSHVYRCTEQKCKEEKIKVEPEQERTIVLKHCKIGLDVTIEVGKLRHKERKTFKEIRSLIEKKYNLTISEREVGHQNQTYLTLLNMTMKKAQSMEWEKLKSLKGIVLAIDGIKPDLGDEVLYLVQEVQTGYILAAKMLEYVNNEEIRKVIQAIKKMPFKILGIVSDNESVLRRAIGDGLPDIPHQLCQYHFLKQIGRKAKDADRRLKKNSR